MCFAVWLLSLEQVRLEREFNADLDRTVLPKEVSLPKVVAQSRVVVGFREAVHWLSLVVLLSTVAMEGL